MKDRAWLESRCTRDGDCLLWDGALQSKGYPQAHIDGKHWLVNRYVYTEMLGKRLPKGWTVSTKCRNLNCLSETCLMTRSRGQILKLAYASGARSPDRESMKHRARAVRDGWATRLSMEKAREIRTRSHTETMSALASEYDVHIDTISRVIKHRLWAEGVNGSSVFNWRP